MSWLRGAAILFLVSACAAKGTVPQRAADFPDDPPECVGDDDCVIARVGECCAACTPQARVWSRVQLAQAEARCQKVQCSAPKKAVRCRHVEPAPLGVRCVEHRCREWNER